MRRPHLLTREGNPPLTTPDLPAAPTAWRPALAAATRAGTVALLGLTVLATVQHTTGLGVSALPFAASVALVALAPSAPLARPRAVLLGHAGAAAVALLASAAAGPGLRTATLATGVAVVLMSLLRAPHPPAAATAALVGSTAPGPGFLLPVALAAALVVALAALARRLPDGRRPPADPPA